MVEETNDEEIIENFYQKCKRKNVSVIILFKNYYTQYLIQNSKYLS